MNSSIDELNSYEKNVTFESEGFTFKIFVIKSHKIEVKVALT